MAANQELKNYITEQTKLGVSKDTIKSALLSAGWKEDDISQAVAEASLDAQGAVASKPYSPIQPVQEVKPSQPTQPIQSIQQTQPVQQAKPVDISRTFKPAGVSVSSSPAVKSPVSFVTSDIFQPKGESVFQSPSAKSQTASASTDVKPQTISMQQSGKSSGKGGKILPITLGVLSLALLGGDVYFFLQNGDLNSKLSSLGSGKTSSDSQITSLSAEKNNLTQQIDSLNKTVADLNNQLAIFAVPADSSSTPVSFSITGTLSGGGKLAYSLTTNKNITLSIKNSKDADVETVLRPLVGGQVSLAGTHQPGSNQLTVETVNGQPVLGAAKAAAATAAASKASSTVSSSTQNVSQNSISTSTSKTATSTP